MTAYVTRQQVLDTFDTAPSAGTKLSLIDEKIETASSELDAEVGFTFERSPASSTSTFLVRGRGGSVLHLHGDVPGLAVTPTSVSFLDVWGGTATLVASADYLVEQWDPASGQFDHIRLLGTTSGYDTFPDGYGLIQIVGAIGFDTVPQNVQTAVIDRTRQLYHADPSLIGGVMGPEEAGRIVQSLRWPDTFYRVVNHYRRRYATCYYR